CLHRLDQLGDGASGPSVHSVFLPTIREWSERTEIGDRAELEDLPEDLPFWSDISATAETCLGTDCPRYEDCFVTKMRQRAAESDLVIVNHHLLCADAAVRQSDFGEVIPACHYAVVDEAHQLEDVATQYFGIVVSNYRIDDLGRDVDRAVAAKLIEDPDTAAALKDRAERVRDLARPFFSALQMLRFDGPGVGGSEARVRIGAPQINRVADEGLSLVRALEALEAEIALARNAPPDVLALSTRAAETRKD